MQQVFHLLKEPDRQYTEVCHLHYRSWYSPALMPDHPLCRCLFPSVGSSPGSSAGRSAHSGTSSGMLTGGSTVTGSAAYTLTVNARHRVRTLNSNCMYLNHHHSISRQINYRTGHDQPEEDLPERECEASKDNSIWNSSRQESRTCPRPSIKTPSF